MPGRVATAPTPFGPRILCAGDDHEVGARPARRFEAPDGLHGVDVEADAARSERSGDLGDRLDHAGLVVHGLERDETDVGAPFDGARATAPTTSMRPRRRRRARTRRRGHRGPRGRRRLGRPKGARSPRRPARRRRRRRDVRAPGCSPRSRPRSARRRARRSRPAARPPRAPLRPTPALACPARGCSRGSPSRRAARRRSPRGRREAAGSSRSSRGRSGARVRYFTAAPRRSSPPAPWGQRSGRTPRHRGRRLR